MSKAGTRFATLLACAAAFSLPASALAEKKTAKDRGEAELAEILEGREAGEPVKCLRLGQRDGLQIVDGTALVFRDGRTLYVNRTNSPRYIDDFDIPVFKPFGSSLCSLDQVEWRDRFNGFGGPIVTLREFVPYTKVEQDS